MHVRITWLLLALLTLVSFPGWAADWQHSAQTALHMLDYVGVDYPEAVQNGKVVDADEYKEQIEFAGQVLTLISGLPEHKERPRLIAQGKTLVQLVSTKAAGDRVSAEASKLRWAIVEVYQLSISPKTPPDLARGRALYKEHCVSCHGVEGKGDGPLAKGLDPKPSDFHDRARMEQRSVYGLYNTISLGVAGTGMSGFSQLSEEERWALAFHVSAFPIFQADLAKGKAAWESGAHAKNFDLKNVVTLSGSEVSARFGSEAISVQHWLRLHPEAMGRGSSPIDFTISKLNESFASYTKGESAQALQLAVTAYLEGFELIEAGLDNVDLDLRLETEREMMRYRELLKTGAAPGAVEQQLNRIIPLLHTAERRLNDGSMSTAGAFTASLFILLREGLEAILVLAAIITFLVKSGRRDVLPWVHAGWIAALVLGVITWIVATHVVAISGAHRELTEGITALIASVMLIYVGFWLHSKSHLHAWQQFINQQVSRALVKKTLWAMAAVSFLAVYRELFEVVLFYQTLWVQVGTSGRTPLLGGIGVAALLLAAIGWAIFRYGVRLPIGPFFGAMSALLVMLAVVFAGQGVAALQEAGIVGVHPVTFVRVPMLGIFPTLETLAAQLFVLAVIGLSFYAANRSNPKRRKT